MQSALGILQEGPVSDSSQCAGQFESLMGTDDSIDRSAGNDVLPRLIQRRCTKLLRTSKHREDVQGGARELKTTCPASELCISEADAAVDWCQAGGEVELPIRKDYNPMYRQPAPSHKRRVLYRSKSVSFLHDCGSRARQLHKRRRHELPENQVVVNCKIPKSPTALSSESPPNSDEFSSELEEIKRKNAELSASLSAVQAELESLKLTVQVEKEGAADYVPGTITGAVQELYTAQKEWQAAMMSRLKSSEERQKEKFQQLTKRVGFADQFVDGKVFEKHSLDDFSKLTADKNATVNTLAVTREKLDNLRVRYSLQKSLLLHPDDGDADGYGRVTQVPCQSVWHSLSTSGCLVAPSIDKLSGQSSKLKNLPFGHTDHLNKDIVKSLRTELLLPTTATSEVEAKCQRLERLVAVLRKKVLTS